MARWGKLALEPDSASVDEVMEAIMRQLVLEAVEPDVRAYLLRMKKEDKSFAEFVEARSAYQEAYGRKPVKAQVLKLEKQAEPVGTGQCLKIATNDHERVLASMTMDERQVYITKHSLCFNCLRNGHRAISFMNKARCQKCHRKHHTVLHFETPPNKVRTYGMTSMDNVYLMTAVAEIKGSRRAKVRVFLDQGAQSSFVSTELLEAIKPPCIGTKKLMVQPFGSQPMSMTAKVYRLEINGSTTVSIEAMEKPDLELAMTRPSTGCRQRWAKRGIELSDQPLEGVPDAIHILIGADYADEILIEKHQHGGETAWRSKLGWIMSGPGKDAKMVNGTQVGSVQTDLEFLWRLEEPSESACSLPAFPLRKKGSTYEVGLLWKGDERPEDNRTQAMAAANSLVRKLELSGKRPQHDDVLIKEYCELEAIERESAPETEGYYLPHHAVVRENAETAKVRVVFNASAAKRGEKSLNNLLNAVPSLLPDLTGLLLRFRELSVGVQADIRKASFMIDVKTEDRPFLRFVWPDENRIMTAWRLRKVPFGVNCSPFLLTAVLQHHLKTVRETATDEKTKAINTMLESFYVDDCVSSESSKEAATNFKRISCAKLAEAGMALRNWSMNEGEDAKTTTGKVLGLNWCTQTDRVSLAALESLEPPKMWTRRTLLQAVATAFDPLGLVAPVLLEGKMLLQRAWTENGTWDTPLLPSLTQAVADWWGAIGQITEVRVPRWIGGMIDTPVTLHLFTDASEKGYGCCIYVTTQDKTHLIFTKCKVAPLKQQTLARLELQACYKGAKCLQFVREELRLPVREVHAWTDSLMAVYWITGLSYKWKTWVANCVAEIQRISEKSEITWHHCPGTENPADLASRGTDVQTLLKSAWLTGPEWVKSPENWPTLPTLTPTDESVAEVKLNVVQTAPTEPEEWWKSISSWSKVKAVVRRMLSWRHRSLSVQELDDKAEVVLVKAIQTEFAQELHLLKASKDISRQSRLFQMRPYVDEYGVLRATGRLQLADIEETTKHPVILTDHYLTSLLLRHVHERRMHQGVEVCLAFIRRKHLVLSGRRIMRRIKEACVTCRRYDASPAAELPAPLPADRVIHKRAFAVVGVDHAGPVLVKNGDSRVKAWILLFVCATMRAVHLELVLRLSTEDFLRALRRFVARYGQPSIIRSDNALVFVAAAREVSSGWRFNPPASPRHGGFYERLVAVVKAPLRKVLGRALVSRDELATLLAEVQFIVNERPLVGGLGDLPPLTPNMMTGLRVERDCNGEEMADDHLVMNKRIKYLGQLRRNVEVRWRQEYLLSLKSFHESHSHSLCVGDLVLVVDDQRKRSM